jgi:hypothetical protein
MLRTLGGVFSLVYSFPVHWTNMSTISDKAFDQAIQEGRLSANPNSPVYAGKYMYMGQSKEGRALFKHRDTREYLK